MPRRHVSSFTELRDAERDALLEVFTEATRRVKRLCRNPDVNEIWREWGPGQRRLHVRLELLPRITGLGGLEVGEGLAVNPYVPEQVASALRRNQRSL